MIPKELRTERLLLRQWREEDAEALAEIYGQPHYLEHNSPLDPDQTKKQILQFTLGWLHEGFSLWAADDLQTGRFVGRIGLIRHDDWPLAADPVEVGWTLHADYTGRGLATEGGRAAVECWREHLDDPQLLSITWPDNRRSRAVMERLGLTYRGETDWRTHHVVWYALDR
ncbi:MAG: GNAT family N-acetyltransferase [Candidatus Limnocylindria bacterium]